jgi:hypothetical protein
MFRKDLVVAAEFDGAKTINEIKFSSIPIWVRVNKMPLGMMTKAEGEVIGELIGEVLAWMQMRTT